MIKEVPHLMMKAAFLEQTNKVTGNGKWHTFIWALFGLASVMLSLFDVFVANE